MNNRLVLILFVNLLLVVESKAQFSRKERSIYCKPAVETFEGQAKNRWYTSKVILVFEHHFDDTVSILADNKLLLKKYMESTSAGRIIDDVVIKFEKAKEITLINGSGRCGYFVPKRGYKYLYIRLSSTTPWSIKYSNKSRMYF